MAESSDDRPKRRLLNAQSICARYDEIQPRTLFKWIEKGLLPQPIRVGNRRFWDEAALNEFEAQRDAKGKGAAS
jgi:hypothetical protein